MSQFVGRGKHIGFLFELDTFNDLEKHHLDSCDELMVCSKWAKGIVDKVGLDVATHVVPLCRRRTIPASTARQDDKTIFFNCGKWEIRKGTTFSLTPLKVLEHGEDAELWMMLTIRSLSEEENKWRQTYDHPQVRLIPRVETQQEVII